MTHLSHEELVRWRDEGAAADRERVVSHLAACDACRRQLSDLVRVGPLAELAAADVQTFAARGRTVYRGAPAVWWRRPIVWTAASAAAAAVLLVIMLPPSTPPVEPSLDVRGTELVAVAPAGAVDRPTEFRWGSPYAAARYEVVVRDTAGGVVVSRETTAERLVVSSDPAFALPPGQYTWIVRALDPSGRELAVSSPLAFTVR